MGLDELKKCIDNLTSGLSVAKTREVLTSVLSESGLRELSKSWEEHHYKGELTEILAYRYEEALKEIKKLSSLNVSEYIEINGYIVERIKQLPSKEVAAKSAGFTIEHDKRWTDFEKIARIENNFFDKQKAKINIKKLEQVKNGKPELFFFREVYKVLLPFQKNLFKQYFAKEAYWLDLETVQGFKERQCKEVDDFYSSYNKDGKNWSAFVVALGEGAKTLTEPQRNYLLSIQGNFLGDRTAKRDEAMKQKFKKFHKEIREQKELEEKLSKEKGELSTEELTTEEEIVEIEKAEEKFALLPSPEPEKKKIRIEEYYFPEELLPQRRILAQIEKAVKNFYGDDYRQKNIPSAGGSTLHLVQKDEQGQSYLKHLLIIEPDELAKDNPLNFGQQVINYFLIAHRRLLVAGNVRLVGKDFFSTEENLYKKKDGTITGRLLNEQQSKQLIGAVVVCGRTVGTMANWLKNVISETAQVERVPQVPAPIPSMPLEEAKEKELVEVQVPEAPVVPAVPISSPAFILQSLKASDSDDEETKQMFKELEEERKRIEELTELRQRREAEERRRRHEEKRSRIKEILSKTKEEREKLEEQIAKSKGSAEKTAEPKVFGPRL